jgi:hypothetical protein
MGGEEAAPGGLDFGLRDNRGRKNRVRATAIETVSEAFALPQSGKDLDYQEGGFCSHAAPADCVPKSLRNWWVL